MPWPQAFQAAFGGGTRHINKKTARAQGLTGNTTRMGTRKMVGGRGRAAGIGGPSLIGPRARQGIGGPTLFSTSRRTLGA
jgi:hypothetical protein